MPHDAVRAWSPVHPRCRTHKSTTSSQMLAKKAMMTASTPWRLACTVPALVGQEQFARPGVRPATAPASQADCSALGSIHGSSPLLEM